MRKWLWFLFIILVFAAASVLTVTVVIPLIKYNRASAALNEGRYEEAIAALLNWVITKAVQTSFGIPLSLLRLSLIMVCMNRLCRIFRARIVPGQL